MRRIVCWFRGHVEPADWSPPYEEFPGKWIAWRNCLHCGAVVSRRQSKPPPD